jgi:hypothetical protein
MSYAGKIEDLIAERDELRRQVHNLNWALSMPGFEQMATPEDQAEHEAGVAAVDAVLARMEHNKAQHDAMVKDAERYRWLRDSNRIPRGADPEGHIVVCAGGGEDVLWGEQMDAKIDSDMQPGAVW